MNLICTHCSGRYYSAAAHSLIGSPCVQPSCSGRLVPSEETVREQKSGPRRMNFVARSLTA